MSDYWEFINIDHQESTGDFEKMKGITPLPGIFFRGDPAEMIKLVAVPVVPQENMRSSDGVRPEGSWAGCRLICLRDWEFSSWPKGVVAQSDFSWRNEDYTVPDSDFPWEDENHVENGPWERWEIGSDSDDDVDIPEYCTEAFTKRCSRVDARWRDRNGPLNFPDDRVWVLRNLSKKKFVRSNGLPARNHEDGQWSYYNHRGIDGYPGLAHVLVANIGWSCPDKDATWISEDIDLSQGAWAGDRFDVRLFEDVEQDMAAEGWVDETRKQAERLYQMLNKEDEIKEGEFPEDQSKYSTDLDFIFFY